jgi:regulatory protein
MLPTLGHSYQNVIPADRPALRAITRLPSVAKLAAHHDGEGARARATCHLGRMAHRPPRPAGPALDVATLHDAALAYLARYAATEAGLRSVLERRVDRWKRLAQQNEPDAEAIAAQAAAARNAVREVVARLVAAGAVNDAAYAESRARSLVRAGRSRRAVSAYLAAKGVVPETAAAATATLALEQSELAAALVLARKRRIGSFRHGQAPDEAGRRRELGVLARAGFSGSIAHQALTMDLDQAEALVNELRR